MAHHTWSLDTEFDLIAPVYVWRFADLMYFQSAKRAWKTLVRHKHPVTNEVHWRTYAASREQQPPDDSIRERYDELLKEIVLEVLPKATFDRCFYGSKTVCHVGNRLEGDSCGHYAFFADSLALRQRLESLRAPDPSQRGYPISGIH